MQTEPLQPLSVNVYGRRIRSVRSAMRSDRVRLELKMGEGVMEGRIDSTVLLRQTNEVLYPGSGSDFCIEFRGCPQAPPNARGRSLF